MRSRCSALPLLRGSVAWYACVLLAFGCGVLLFLLTAPRPSTAETLPLFAEPVPTQATLLATATQGAPGAAGPSLGPPAVQRGPVELVTSDLLVRTAIFFTSFGLYLLVAITFLLQWVFNRRDVQACAVGLLALVMALHTMAASGTMAYLFPTALGLDARFALEASSFLLLNGLVAFLLWAFFPHAFYAPAGADAPMAAPLAIPGWLRTANTAVAGTAAGTSLAFSVAALLTPTTALWTLPAARWISILLMVVTIALAMQAVERRIPQALGLALAFAFIVVGTLYDAFFASVEGDRTYVLTYAFLAFVLLQSYLVSRRNAAYAELAFQNTERLQHEVAQRTKALRAASIAAQAANLAKSQFLTAVSHELRTPLASMLGYTQLLEDELQSELAPRQHEFFHTIHTSGDRLLALINDLLDLAKIEAGRLDLNLGDVDVRTVALEVRDQMYPLANNKGLSLKLTTGDEDLHVHSDEQRLRQVLLNLLSNAIKFTDEGGITIRVFATEHRGAPAVGLTVADTGSGISPEFMAQLFDRFTQEPHDYERAPRGTGLGLTISRELVHRMNGEIHVKSELGRGSVFDIVLPRV